MWGCEILYPKMEIKPRKLILCFWVFFRHFSKLQKLISRIQNLGTFLGHQLYRVNQLVTEHLSTQGRLDRSGGLHCFWHPNKT
jgi:hypothetical protein